MQKKSQEAKRHLDSIRKLVAKRPSPFVGMSKDQVIDALRQTREQLWEKKLGIRA